MRLPPPAATAGPAIRRNDGAALRTQTLSSSGWWALAAVATLTAVYFVAVGTPTGQRLDQLGMEAISAAVGSTTWAELILLWVSAGSMLLATGLVIMATAALRGRRPALLGAGAAGAVVIIAELLKLVLDRPVFLAGAAGNSFPSGHVAAVAGLGVALVIAVPRAVRWLVTLLVVGPAAGLTGLATIVLQWHRPSDVVGSLLIAVAVGALAARLSDQPTPG